MNYEISGCIEDSEHNVETCEDSKAEFFTVYKRYPSGEVQALADFYSKHEAISYKRMLERLSYLLN